MRQCLKCHVFFLNFSSLARHQDNENNQTICQISYHGNSNPGNPGNKPFVRLEFHFFLRGKCGREDCGIETIYDQYHAIFIDTQLGFIKLSGQKVEELLNF